jgi:hypothetical protein
MTGSQRAVEHHQDAIHRVAAGRHAVVDDRLTQVFDASSRRGLERQQVFVRCGL